MLTKLYCSMVARVKSEEGATAVEYGIMVSLIAAVIIITVSLIGDKILAAFDKVLANLK